MAAAGKKNWPLAVKHYTEAQRRLHLSPQVMYNLALAHAQAGNELLADVWFRAYLGAVPQAANADQVRAEIARLEQAADEKVRRLFKQAEDLAEALPLAGESQLDVTGRRAAAFFSISVFRRGVGDFKGAYDDYVKTIKYQVKNLHSEPDPKSRALLGADLFVKTLAEVGDIEGALRLRDQLENGYERKNSTEKICFVLLFAGNPKKSMEIAAENDIRFDAFDCHWFAEAFAREGDYANARIFAERAGRESTYLFIAESQLSRGDIAEAVRYARLAGDDAVGMAIRGEPEAAFQSLKNSKPGVVSPYLYIKDLNRIIMNLIRLGDMGNARKAVGLAPELIKQKSRNDRFASGLALLGNLYLDVETGKTDEILKTMDRGLLLTNLYQDSREKERKGTEQEYAKERAEWLSELCSWAIERKQPAAAERIADSFAESRERIEFLRRVLAVYDSKADRVNTERLTKKLAGLLAEVQAGGWNPENPGREFVVNAWTDAAYALDAESALVNLPGRIAEIKKESSPDEMPVQIAICASEIGKGLLRIRALDRIYR